MFGIEAERRFVKSTYAVAPMVLVVALALTFPARGQSPESLIRTVIHNTGLSGNIAKRREAQKKLVRLGRLNSAAIVPLIVTELKKPHRYKNAVLQQRIALIETLRDIGVAAEAAVPALTAILEDQDRRLEWVHFSINMALDAIGTPSGADARYADTLRTLEDWKRTARPADIAAAIRWHDFSIRQNLRRHRLAEGVIEASVLPLLVLGPKARGASPTLLRAYADRRVGDDLRGVIEDALAAMGIDDAAKASAALPAPPDPLAEIIADAHVADDQISVFAIRELVRFAPDARAVDVLIGLLRDGRNPAAVANALMEIGPPAARALPDLLPHMGNRRDGANVIQAVGRLGADNPSAVAALRSVLADQRSPHRGGAAAALGQLKAEAAVPELIAALSARRKYTRILSAQALARIGPPKAAAAVPHLAALLDDPDHDIQRAAAEALASMGPAAAPAAPALERLLQSSDHRIKRAAESALAKTGGDTAVHALEAEAGRYQAADRREVERLLARNDFAELARLLRRLPEARAVPLSRRLMTDDHTLVAYMAIGVLIRAGHRADTLPALADIIASGRAETDLKGRLGYDWLHSDAPERFEGMFELLGVYLKAHKGNYSAEEQARIEPYLRAFTR